MFRVNLDYLESNLEWFIVGLRLLREALKCFRFILEWLRGFQISKRCSVMVQQFSGVVL
jgi:hypothetical protein